MHLKLEAPEFVPAEEYQKQLLNHFKTHYEKVEIEEELELLLGNVQETVIIQPDDHFEGF